jgi:lipoprotein NlpI
MCEAYFYSGSRHLFSGENKTAIDLLKKCIATDHKDFTEYVSALAELNLLEEPKK